jgi:hypothetical protein
MASTYRDFDPNPNNLPALEYESKSPQDRGQIHPVCASTYLAVRLCGGVRIGVAELYGRASL